MRTVTPSKRVRVKWTLPQTKAAPFHGDSKCSTVLARSANHQQESSGHMNNTSICTMTRENTPPTATHACAHTRTHTRVRTHTHRACMHRHTGITTHQPSLRPVRVTHVTCRGPSGSRPWSYHNYIGTSARWPSRPPPLLPNPRLGMESVTGST